MSVSLVRQQFGEWLVVWQAGMRAGRRLYVCRCSCGTVRLVRCDLLTQGKSASCNGGRHGTYTQARGRRPLLREHV